MSTTSPSVHRFSSALLSSPISPNSLFIWYFKAELFLFFTTSRVSSRFELMIQDMARKGGNKILTSPCFSKIFLFYISLLLSIPCLSFIYSIWFLLISIPVLLFSTLLHISLYNKKPASPGSLQTPVQEGTPKFYLQDNFRGQGTETEPETSHKAKEVMKLEAADSINDENEEEEEGLIEIALAGEEAKEEKMYTVMKCLSDSGLIKQEKEKIMMEIWTEVEEENFIEIDLSMGSITSLKV